MTESAYGTTLPTAAGTLAQISITETTVGEIADVLGWYDLPPHKADKAAREVLATIALAGSVPAQHVPAPPVVTSAPTRHPATTAATTVDIDPVAGRALPDPTAPGARAIVQNRYGELVVDDGLKYRTPQEAEMDGRTLVLAGQEGDGLALIAAARHANELNSRQRRRRHTR